jgi:chaperonin cofactor prefoldin
MSKGQSLEYFITIYSLGTSDSRPKWKDSGKAKLEKLLQANFARMSAPTLAQFSQLQSDLLTALRRISVLEDALRQTQKTVDILQEVDHDLRLDLDSGLTMHDDRLRALEMDAEDDASSVYVSDEDSGG